MASVNRKMRRAAERGKDVSRMRFKERSHGGKLKDFERPHSLNIFADHYDNGEIGLVFPRKGGQEV